MSFKSTLLKITAYGTPIVNFATTFIRDPPLMTPGEAGIVYWKKAMAAALGIITIASLSKKKSRKVKPSKPIYRTIVSLIFLIGYLLTFETWTANCYNNEKNKFVVGTLPGRNDEWTNTIKTYQSQGDYQSKILDFSSCQPREAWTDKEIIFRYCVILLLYIGFLVFLDLAITSLIRLTA